MFNTKYVFFLVEAAEFFETVQKIFKFILM